VTQGSESFPKSARLRKRSEYRRVQERGRKVHTPHFLVFVIDQDGEETRLGITVSRKVGNAVLRNLLKRRIREAYRRHRDVFPPGKEIVVLVKRGVGDLDAAKVEDELLRAGKRL
jgi:ribonuclease P protein component